MKCSEKQQLPVFHEHSLPTCNEGASKLMLDRIMFAYSTCTGFLSTCISQMVVSSSIDNLGPRNSTIDLSFSVYCDWCRLPGRGGASLKYYYRTFDLHV